ncbi:MAG TPA: TonB-dependent receptor [Woeseiaceae bacterium]|nr:TonB-dependent receptor [Woeseiaceae bacterium]
MVIARARRARVGIPAGWSAVAVALAPVLPAGAEPAAVTEPLDEIVVTARKKAEDLLDVPMSVQVVTGAFLDTTNETSLLDLQFDVPGLVITNLSMFGTGVSLRGVTDQGGGSLAVAMHLDGVPLGNSRLAMARVFDVERIEIVKGPQGTLYGRNSTGGSINIVNRAATTSAGASAEFGAGSYGLRRMDGHVNLPLGQSAVRLAAAAAGSDGYLRNTVDDRNFAEDDFLAARLSWRIAPTESLAVDVRLQRVDDDGGLAELWMPRPDFLPDTADPYLTTVTHPDPFLHLVSDDASVAVEMDFEAVSLYSLTGYVRNRTDNIDDCAGVPFLHGCVRAALPNAFEQWSQELRLQSSAGAAIEWLAGLFYAEGDDETNYYLSVPAAGTAPRNARNTRDRNRSLAAFGQATWRFGEPWRLTAGARYSRDEARMTTEGAGVNDSPVPVTGTDSWNNSAWRLGIDYAAGESALLFASIATGFKSGGFVPEVLPGGELDQYAPEHVLAYEAGLNVAALDGRASLRAAAFYYDFTDIQVTTTAIVDGEVSTVTDNASSALIYGLDLSATVPFGERWSASGGVVWLPERNYLEYVTIDTSEDVSGNYLSRAPEWSATAAIEYRTALAAGTFSARLDASYRSDVFFTRGNLPQEAQDGFALANLYLRYEARSERWYLYASGRNLGDETYYTQVFLQSAVGLPRNWEAGFGLRY